MRILDREEHKREIELLEQELLDIYIQREKQLLEVIRDGRSIDSLIDTSGMKERYLKALAIHGPIGLTPVELNTKIKKIAWLTRPGDDHRSIKDKTISMFLLRLYRHGLADRKKEKRTWRYFININGTKRLRYYENKRKYTFSQKPIGGIQP